MDDVSPLQDDSLTEDAARDDSGSHTFGSYSGSKFFDGASCWPLFTYQRWYEDAGRRRQDALPRALGPMRRDQEPGSGERIVPPVGDVVEHLVGHFILSDGNNLGRNRKKRRLYTGPRHNTNMAGQLLKLGDQSRRNRVLHLGLRTSARGSGVGGLGRRCPGETGECWWKKGKESNKYNLSARARDGLCESPDCGSAAGHLGSAIVKSKIQLHFVPSHHEPPKDLWAIPVMCRLGPVEQALQDNVAFKCNPECF